MKEEKERLGISAMLEEDMVPLSSYIAKKKAKWRGGRHSSGKKRGSGLRNTRTRSKTKMLSDSESDKDLVLCGKNEEGSLRNKREVRNNKKVGGQEPAKCEDAKICGKNIDRYKNVKKRGRMDVFEYNEDDIVDIKKIEKEVLNKGRRNRGREMKTSCGSDNVIEKKKSPSCSEKSGLSAKRNRVADLLDKKRSEVKEDEVSFPANTQREKDVGSVNNPGRIQGKNGVFKVIINHKKENGLEKTYDNFPEKPCSSVITEDNQLNLQNISIDNDKAHCSRTDGNSLMQPGSNNVNTCDTLKEERNEGEATVTHGSCLSARNQGGKVKRSVEKGLIRDQIKAILMNEGWKIDFRPRRNRNYNDAVYVSPSGSVFWSILNAYNAVKKKYVNEAGDCNPSGTSSSFTPIPNEFLNQLTRQTRKKTMREMMMKLGVKKSGKRTGGTFKKTSSKNVRVKHGKGSARGIRLSNSEKVKAKANSFGARKKMSKVTRVHSASNASADKKKIKKQRGYTLLVRNSSKDMNLDDDSFSPYAGKRTILSWMIDEGIVPLNGKVKYMNKRRTRAMMEGQILRDGIHCGCCSKTLTLLDFEIHAGSKLQQPFENIFIETGATLLECLLNAWNKLEESEHNGFRYVNYTDDDPNDDTCGICGDGGDLICCDSCPSTFHQSCLGIEDLPSGDWHCANCVCKFCGVVGGSNDQAADATVSKFHACILCEEKYHGSCSQQTNVVSSESNSQGLPFCEQECKEIFENLQKLVGCKQELGGGYTWTLIQRSDLESDTPFLGLTQKAECNSKLAVALSVMDECFLPIVDRRSGINLIPNVIYNCGSNFNRLNFSGFYTAVLERGDEMISAASIRIHGTKLAEMPFIGTRPIYRRQGMFRRLLSAIESALCSLGVMKLIIPAIDELMHAWTIVFGFKLLEESHKEQIRSMNMLVFPGIDLLLKILLKQGNFEVATTRSLADKLERNHQMKHEMTSKSSRSSCVTVDIVASDETLGNGTNDRVSDARGADLPSANCSMPDTCDPIDNPADASDSLHFASCGEETASEEFQSRSEFCESSHAQVGSKPVMDSTAETYLKSLESAVGDAHGMNVRVDDECDLHLLDKTSGQRAAEVVCVLPDTSSASNILVTDGRDFHCNTDFTDLNTAERKNKLDVNGGVGCIASHCEKVIINSSDDSSEHDGGGVKTEVAAVA